MIGIDTNVLVRAFLEDEATQAHLAQIFMENTAKSGNLFISSYALLEFVWVLKVKKFSREEIYNAVITLTDSQGITIGQRDVILTAIEKFYKGKADFGDYMILAEGEKNGAQLLKTFDQTFAEESSYISAPD